MGRLVLTRLLQRQPQLHVVEADGATALLAQIRRLKPSLLIVGEQQLREVESLSHYVQMPVVLCCEKAPLSGMLSEASRWGVQDFIVAESSGGSSWTQVALRKIMALIPRSKPSVPKALLRTSVPRLLKGVVVIGGSTGGTKAVERLIRSLPASLACAILVNIHLPVSFQDSFVARLRRAANMPVVSGTPGTLLEPGRIVVAPGGHNLVVKRSTNMPWQAWQTDYSFEPSPSGDEPSVDLLMQSVAQTVGANVLGVILTGLGHDGTLGAQAIRLHGGTVLVQDEASSAVFSMPQSVIKHGWANTVLALDDLAAAIVQHTDKFRLGVGHSARAVSAHAVGI